MEYLIGALSLIAVIMACYGFNKIANYTANVHQKVIDANNLLVVSFGIQIVVALMALGYLGYSHLNSPAECDTAKLASLATVNFYQSSPTNAKGKPLPTDMAPPLDDKKVSDRLTALSELISCLDKKSK